MPQEGINALAFSTLTKADGTIISRSGVTLSDGTHLTHAEWDARQEAQKAADDAFDAEMLAETTRHSKN